MKRFWHLFILSMFLLLGCSYPKVNQKTPLISSESSATAVNRKNVNRWSDENASLAYPHWFWQPYLLNLPFPTAVGYATSLHPEKAEKEAIENGIENLAKCMRTRIQGAQISTSTRLVERFEQKFVEEEIGVAGKKNLQETHQILATYQTTYRGDSKLKIVLVGLGETHNLVNNPTITTSAAPGWIQQSPHKKGYIYARGQSSMGYYPFKAWARAEKSARIDLALNSESKFAAIKRKSGQIIGVASWAKIDITLQNIETVARWYDAQHRTCYVLIRAPIAAH